MNKKIIAVMALTLMLASCGTKIESQVTTPAPINIDSESLGKTGTGFASDLNSVVEEAYQNAASGTTVTQ